MGTPLGVGALPGPSPAGGDGPGAAGQGWVSPGGSGSPPPTLDELLTPLSQKLQYLLRKVEDFQSHLLYRWGHGGHQVEGMGGQEGTRVHKA